MRLEQSFEVPVPVSVAWGVLLDLERTTPCMPGATLASFDGTAFTGTVTVKLGATAVKDLRRALKAGRGAQAFLVVEAQDAAQNSSRTRLQLTLKPKPKAKTRR